MRLPARILANNITLFRCTGVDFEAFFYLLNCCALFQHFSVCIFAHLLGQLILRFSAVSKKLILNTPNNTPKGQEIKCVLFFLLMHAILRTGGSLLCAVVCPLFLMHI